MKELNELVELAQLADLNADWTAIKIDLMADDYTDEISDFIEACSPDAIRSLAEAFRALEQRAEAAEAKLQAERETSDIIMESLRQKEAKLAEYEKQKPVAWTDDGEMRDIKNQAAAYIFPINDTMPIIEPQRVIELFTRPAPAVSLAELVPPKASMADFYENVTAGNRSDPDAAGIEMWDACRAAMLRNIEEAK